MTALQDAPETLPARWYHDPAVFARERELIFARHWTLLARLDQLARPGDFVRASLAGRPVFVIRGRDGGLKGFHNVCRHRAGPLVRADAGHCDVLRCGYHGWVYDHDGALVKAPNFIDDSGFDRGGFHLFPLRTALWNGLVFATLDDSAPDLEAWLGDIVAIAADFPALETMTFQREVVMEGQANWKTYGDNSVEGYHVTMVHKALDQALAPDSVTIEAYENGKFVGFDVRYGQGPRGSGRGFWIYQFPGLLLHFGADSLNIEQVIPEGPGTIRLVRWFWALGPGNPDAMAESTQVMREDLAICEAVQRNLQAGVYRTGRLSPQAEPGTIFFQRLVREALSES